MGPISMTFEKVMEILYCGNLSFEKYYFDLIVIGVGLFYEPGYMLVYRGDFGRLTNL